MIQEPTPKNKRSPVRFHRGKFGVLESVFTKGYETDPDEKDVGYVLDSRRYIKKFGQYEEQNTNHENRKTAQ